MFRVTVDAPSGFHRENEATRALRDFELVLRAAGAETRRQGTSMAFHGSLLTDAGNAADAAPWRGSMATAERYRRL
jgi:hypothetical protein